MNTKKVALIGASTVVLAGALVYALGIYPPASGRDGRGAIGQRNVYRADQPADASVNPNDAPVATADQLKNQQVVTLQNGQLFQMINGQMYQVQNSQMVAVQDGLVYRMNNGIMVRMQNGALYRMEGGQFVQRLNSDQFVVHQMANGQVVALQNGVRFQVSNGQMLALKNEMQNGIARY